MMVLIAPNGVIVNASEQDAPVLLAAGYTKANEEQEAPQRKKRQTRRTAKQKE